MRPVWDIVSGRKYYTPFINELDKYGILIGASIEKNSEIMVRLAQIRIDQEVKVYTQFGENMNDEGYEPFLEIIADDEKISNKQLYKNVIIINDYDDKPSFSRKINNDLYIVDVD